LNDLDYIPSIPWSSQKLPGNFLFEEDSTGQFKIGVGVGIGIGIENECLQELSKIMTPTPIESGVWVLSLTSPSEKPIPIPIPTPTPN
jgi:hypothetical protein